MRFYFLIVSILFVFLNHGFCQIQLHDDEFSNSATLNANWLNIDDVEQWNAEHLETFDINTSTAGKLHMMPYTSSWFQDYRGTLIFKEIENDFIITTNIDATNRANSDMPGPQYSLAGVMIRTARNYPNGALGAGGWTAGGENYIFLSVGFAATNHPSCNGCPGPHFEVKNTTNGNSNLQVSSVSGYEDVHIRVARVDTAILVLYQESGGSWTVRERYARTDFPDTLQVGFVTYTDWQKVNTYVPFFHNSNVLNSNLNPDPSSNPGLAFNPDLIGKFDFARFEIPEVPPSLQGVDLVTQATDAELLSFLGHNSIPFCPDSIHVMDPILPGQIADMQAAMEITSDHLVESDGIMNYSAMNGIELLAGFEVELGAEITIDNDGCN